MKKVIIVLGVLAVVAAVAVFAWVRNGRSADEIPLEMGSFESAPPSEKNFKVDDMNIKFDGKTAPAAKKAPAAKRGE